MVINSSKFQPIQVFLSYSSKDKEIAGQVKTNLEKYGLQVFLAHEDIEPSETWQEVILQKLDECEIFIPIVSENFRHSRWTDQESGIALAKDKFILPVNIDIVPYGFLGKFQSLKLSDNIPSSCVKILDIIKKTPFYDRIKESFIDSFIKSRGFYETNEKAHTLEDYEPFSKDQLNRLVNGFVTNDQVYGAFVAERVISDLVKRNRILIEPKLLEKFDKIIQEFYK